MRKMPSLFERDWVSGGYATPKVTKGCEWVIDGEGWATEKVDGAACAIINGALYKRYDANVKRGRKPPIDGIPCQEAADPVTGHWPWWVRVLPGIASDQWFTRALNNTRWLVGDGTYEAVGLHFQNNPYGLDDDYLEKHGRIRLIGVPRTFDGIGLWLMEHEVEGIVFYRGNGEMCKVKRKDYGLEWPIKAVWDDGQC